MITFGSWSPDAYDLNSPQAGEASGVLPGANAYHPWPSLQALSDPLGSTSITGSSPVGLLLAITKPTVSGGSSTGIANKAILARKVDGSVTIFVGSTDKIFRFNSATVWDDFSGAAYAVATGTHWSMDQFGPYFIATNGVDNVQVVNVDSGTVFADLGGSPPKASIVKTVGDYVMLGRTENYPTGIEWSGLNDATWWTHGQQSSDYQVFPDGGFVTGITSLETGLIFQENAIRRFAQTADRSIFNFSKVEDGQGNIAPDSLAVVTGEAYFLSRAGFRKCGPSTGFRAAPIGLEVLDQWFKDSINIARLSEVYAVTDPQRPRVFWLAPASGSTSPIMSIMLCCDMAFNPPRWTHTNVMASTIFAGATPGYTLEGLDAVYPNLDSMPISLDSPAFTGGTPFLAGFDDSYKLGFFNGPNQAAVIQTAEFQAIPGKRAFVTGFRPIGDAMNVTGRIASRERPQANPAWGSSSSVNNQGMVPARSSGRLHRIELSIAAGESWTSLQGVDFADNDLKPDGLR